MSISVKERKYTINTGEWLTPPMSDIKVIYQVTKKEDRTTIRSSSNTYDYLKVRWPDIDHYETFVCIFTNRRNEVIGSKIFGMGGITGTIADIRLMLQTAILLNACGIVMAHNHPSGSRTPSRTDEDLTRKMKEAALLHDITVLDHIILTSDGYYSFTDKGLL